MRVIALVVALHASGRVLQSGFYGLIAAGISVVIIATVNSIGTTLNTKFTDISTQLK